MPRSRTYPAFTIVELLIVIVVIAILAAISIVAYTGIQDKARETAALSLVSQTAKKLTAYQATDTNGLYPDSLTATDLNLTDTDRAKLQYSVNNTTTPPTFCITATEGTLSYYQNTTTQTTPAKGGCNGHGQGGVAAITNLVANPSFENGTSGWTTSGNMTPSYSSTGGVMGSAYYRAARTGTAAIGLYAPRTAVTAGQSYQGSMYIRAATGRAYTLRYAWFDSAGGSLTSSTSSSYIANGDWQRADLNFVAPTGASTVRFDVVLTTVGATVGDTLDVDGVMLTEGQTLYGYADGDFAGWTWNGTVRNSSSTGPPL